MVLDIAELSEQAAQAFDEGQAATMKFLRRGSQVSRSLAVQELGRSRSICARMKKMPLLPVMKDAIDEKLSEISKLEGLLEPKNVNILFKQIPDNTGFADVRKFFEKKLGDTSIAEGVATAYALSRHRYPTAKA